MGVNKYKPQEEHQVDVLCIDNKHVRESQIQRLKETRQNRDQTKVNTSKTKAKVTPGPDKGKNQDQTKVNTMTRQR